MKSNNQFILKERVIDNHGRVIEQRFGNGSIRSYEYHQNWVESANRISNIAARINSSGQTFLANLQNLSYGYDAIGNIIQIKDNDEVLNFTYDALNRLTSVGGAYNENYSYNPTTGNLQSKTGIDGEYHYGTSVTRPHAVTGYGNNHNVFEYDSNGQMIKRYGQNITYDIQGNLISYNGDTHVYDGDGNRVMTERGDGSVSVYIGDYYEKFFDSIGIVDPVNPPALLRGQDYKTYLPVIHNGEGADFETISGQSYYYAGSSRIATKTERGDYIWIYGDHLGSTSVTADKNGNELSRSSYYAWGTTRSSTGNQETDYGYTGQMQVGDIYYYNARWYDPAIGRFLQADTIVPPHQGTQGFDRYAYVNNNPLRYTDSSGNGIDDFFDNLIKKAVNVIDTFQRDIIGGQYVRRLDNEINKASQKTDIPTELIAAVIRHESSAIERRIFISDCLADSVEFVQVIIRLQTGRDASIGIGQMQIGTARLLEQTRYVEK
ncbi:MAG: RHS repeat-associated core domain-containing protein, partial [Anaerolineaceae bacterium]